MQPITYDSVLILENQMENEPERELEALII